MNNWTIKKRILFGFSTLIILVTVLAVISFVELRRVRQEAHFMDSDALPGLESMAKIKSAVSDIQIKVLRCLLAKSSEEKQALQNEVAAMREQTLKDMASYEKTISNSEDRELFKKLTEFRDNYVGIRAKLFALVHDGKADEAIAFDATQMFPAYIAYQDQLDKLLKYNIENADHSGERSDKAAQNANLITTGVAVTIIVLGIAFAAVIITGIGRALNNLARQLAEGSVQVAAAATQVSAASQSLAEGASEQAASLEETSASLEEVSSMTRRNAQNAQSAKEFTAQTKRVAEASAASTQAMSSSMAAIRAAGHELRDAMNGIKTASGDVSKIIKTIDEIAFQTNILALNAAVEAARAGEAGMGFAVVADEVRNLAQRSAKAAKETTDMIEASIRRSEDGVRVTEKVTTAVEEVAAKSTELEAKLAEILTKAQQVDEQVGQIASASSEQSDGISQVSIAVSQMDKVTQSNAASAEESASAAEELNAQAEVLKQSVGDLQRLAGEKSDQREHLARAPISYAAKPRAVSKSAGKSPHRVNTNGTHNGSAANLALKAIPSNVSSKQPVPIPADFKDF